MTEEPGQQQRERAGVDPADQDVEERPEDDDSEHERQDDADMVDVLPLMLGIVVLWALLNALVSWVNACAFALL